MRRNLFRKACQLAHGLPDPVPVAAVIVVVVFGVLAATAAAQPDVQDEGVEVRLTARQQLLCMLGGGCLLITRESLTNLVREAEERGGSSCRKGPQT